MTVSEQFNTGASACSVGTTCTIRILISSYNCPTYCQATFWYSSVPPRARCGFLAGLCGRTPSVWRAAACKVFSRAHPQPGILAKCLRLRRCRPWHLGGRRVCISIPPRADQAFCCQNTYHHTECSFPDLLLYSRNRPGIAPPRSQSRHLSHLL